MNLKNDEVDPCWAELTPLLDDAINELGDQDRSAILLRFFEHRSLRSIAEALGTSENAVQKRIVRALDQLHSILGKRGIALSAAALGTLLAVDMSTAAPAGLAAVVAGTALGSATVGGGTSVSLLKIMTMTKLNAAILGTLVVAALSTSIFLERQSLATVRAERNGLKDRNRELQDEVSQLQADKQRLSRLKSNAADPELSQRESELLRLRGEVGSLRQQNQDLTNALKLANASVAEPPNEQGQSAPLGLSFKTAAAQNRGFGSVPSALQTVVWTALNGSPESICALEGDAATNADGSPTPWRDKMVQFYQNLFNGVDSVQLVDTTPRSDGTLEVKMKLQSSKDVNPATSTDSTFASAILKQNEGAWQVTGWLAAAPSPASGQPADARQLRQSVGQSNGR
jgi:hypothetical protein